VADGILVPAALAALGALLVAGAFAWMVSVARRDVTLVDSLWAPFFLLAAAVYAIASPGPLAARGTLVLLLVAVWALRLCVHLTRRNRGKPEDRRYAAMRARHEPGFAWKSLFIVFGLQAVLAWIISAPLFAAIAGTAPPGPVDALALALWLTGFLFEAVGDAQLARFKSDPANAGRVMDRGLWRWTRHPNYFGDACLWWGYWLFAVAAGGAWTVFAPALMTLLLLKVSGVALLERDIGERRPAYRDYVERTSAFVPWPPRRPQAR
jgi:steroid 5-alpha reductase family enzyme